jgi:hypothetical protein
MSISFITRLGKRFSYGHMVVIIAIALPFVAQSDPALTDNQGIVFLGAEQDMQFDELPICLERALKRAEPAPKVISAKQFRNSLYPFFEPGTAPKNARELSIVLGKLKVQQHISELGIRYLVVADSQTRTGEYKDRGLCSYGGCVGAGSADKRTDLAVLIWDLQDVNNQKSMRVSAEGKNVLVWFLLPIPIIADTKEKACNYMSEQILNFVRNEDIDTAIPVTIDDLKPDSDDFE